MGDTDGYGTLEIPADAQVPDPDVGYGQAAELVDALRAVQEFGWDVMVDDAAPGDPVRVHVNASDILYGDVEDLLSDLAATGATGRIWWTRHEQSRWLTVLAGAKMTVYEAVEVYRGDPDPESPIVALRREEVLALLAMVAGEHTEHLPTAVASLTGALHA